MARDRNAHYVLSLDLSVDICSLQRTQTLLLEKSKLWR
jgi:hypothetical protein